MFLFGRARRVGRVLFFASTGRVEERTAATPVNRDGVILGRRVGTPCRTPRFRRETKRGAFFAFFFLVLAYFLVYFLANGVARRYNEKRKVCDALPNLKKNSNERTAKRRRPTTTRVVATLSVAATSG